LGERGVYGVADKTHLIVRRNNDAKERHNRQHTPGSPRMRYSRDP
jgi:hypothetical protein